MHNTIRGLLALGLWLPASWAAAQSETGPTLAAPPTTPSAPAATPAADPPSEPWTPPAGAAVSPPGGVVDELPAPEVKDASATTAPVDAETKALIESGPVTWYVPNSWFGPTPWDSGIELGINGTSGTNDSFSIRSGGYIKRESRFSKLDFNTVYNLTTGDGETTQNNAKVDLTNDWLIDEKLPWTLFAKGTVFYDEFATFDIQTNVNSGIGYRWVHNPQLDFMTRVGVGAQREFGGDDDKWTPESLFGAEYTHRFAKTQKVYSKFEYYPEWDEVGEFRAIADAGWEVELSQPSKLSLKLSVSDRYDSTPEGASPHLLNYSVLMLMKL